MIEESGVRRRAGGKRMDENYSFYLQFEENSKSITFAPFPIDAYNFI